jgi:hypothetical protein
MHVHVPRFEMVHQSSVWEKEASSRRVDVRPLFNMDGDISCQTYHMLSLQSTTFQLPDQITLKVTSPPGRSAFSEATQNTVVLIRCEENSRVGLKLFPESLNLPLVLHLASTAEQVVISLLPYQTVRCVPSLRQRSPITLTHDSIANLFSLAPIRSVSSIQLVRCGLLRLQSGCGCGFYSIFLSMDCSCSNPNSCNSVGL